MSVVGEQFHLCLRFELLLLDLNLLACFAHAHVAGSVIVITIAVVVALVVAAGGG